MSPVEPSSPAKGHSPAGAHSSPAEALTSVERVLCGWGRTAPSRGRLLRPRTPAAVVAVLASAARNGGAIARGAGRSYGDAAQNGGGTVIDAGSLRGQIELDTERGLIRTGAGTTFAELLMYLAARGLTLPVAPGTRHLTVGGAIAADVHGKNHLRDGSLARHVESLMLCTPAHGPRELGAERDRDLFLATLGGMGLTGVVLEATLRVVAMRSPEAVADIDRLEDLEETVALFTGEQTHRYAIAWVDLLAEGKAFGRAVVTRSDEAPARAEPRRTLDTPATAPYALHPRLTVPRRFPPGLLRPATVGAFNATYWHTTPRRARGRRLSMSAQLFPLDALGEWSRLYGPAGLVQYQFAIPDGREEALLRVVRRLRERRQPMYLVVLKRLGAGTEGPLSFPIAGLTLAIDLPAAAPGLRGALEEADELVVEAGGRVYLAKDARMRAQTLAAMYPGLERFRELRERIDPEGVLRSDMGRRLGLCD
jgi:decaprenylphospho-beta-D-ribofuranose 2-oxidase